MKIGMLLDGEINQGIRNAILEIVDEKWITSDVIIVAIEERELSKRMGLPHPIPDDWVNLSIGQLRGMKEVESQRRVINGHNRIVIRKKRK